MKGIDHSRHDMKVLQGLPGPDNKNLGCVESGVQLEGWRGRFAGDASPKADNKLSCLGETRRDAQRVFSEPQPARASG